MRQIDDDSIKSPKPSKPSDKRCKWCGIYSPNPCRNAKDALICDDN